MPKQQQNLSATVFQQSRCGQLHFRSSMFTFGRQHEDTIKVYHFRD